MTAWTYFRLMANPSVPAGEPLADAEISREWLDIYNVEPLPAVADLANQQTAVQVLVEWFEWNPWDMVAHQQRVGKEESEFSLPRHADPRENIYQPRDGSIQWNLIESDLEKTEEMIRQSGPLGPHSRFIIKVTSAATAE